MKTLILKDGRKITDTFQFHVFQTKSEALEFGRKNLEWNPEEDGEGLNDELEQERSSIRVEIDNGDNVDVELNALYTDSGADESFYVYFID